MSHIRIAILALLCLAAVVTLVVRNRRRGERALQPRSGSAPGGGNLLRDAVLGRTILQGHEAFPTENGVAAVVMDWGVGNGVGTLVAFADGTTSLYFSSGGGIIGAGTRPPVQAAAATFRAEAAQRRATFASAARYPLPATQHVVFYLVTPTATLGSGELAVGELTTGASPWSGLWNSAQAVITELRQASQRTPPSGR